MKLPRILKIKKADTSVIPKGPYCYTHNEKGEYVPCPYDKTKIIKGVRVPYCSFLRMKGFSIDWSQKDFKKLHAKYGESIYDWLSLLWDSCKECGVNPAWDEE